MTPQMRRALQRASLVYLTTYDLQGRSGTVPVWFFQDRGTIYFSTRKHTLKVRRIEQTGRATLHIGTPTGPEFVCNARLVHDDPQLQTRLMRHYRKRYWLH